MFAFGSFFSLMHFPRSKIQQSWQCVFCYKIARSDQPLPCIYGWVTTSPFLGQNCTSVSCVESITYWKCGEIYTLFRNGPHLSILWFTCELSLVASFFNWKLKSIFPWTRQQEQIFKQTIEYLNGGHLGTRCMDHTTAWMTSSRNS